MANSTKLERYLQIIERVQQRTSFAELLAHMSSHGIELSPRTLQRDIEQIRVDLGVEVEYDREANTYQIVSKAEGAGVLAQLMERSQLIKLFQDQATVKSLPEQLELEGGGSLKGLRHIEMILRAIRERKEVELTYRKGKKGRLKECSFHPVRIREYQSRWFVFGIAVAKKRLMVCSLDVVDSLVLKSETITEGQMIDARERSSEIMGVDVTKAKEKKLKVRFASEVAKGIRSLPWHHSQCEGKTKDDRTTFVWKLRPNKDLIQRILQYGVDAQVLKPKALVKEIRDQHRLAQKQYKK